MVSPDSHKPSYILKPVTTERMLACPSHCVYVISPKMSARQAIERVLVQMKIMVEGEDLTVILVLICAA